MNNPSLLDTPNPIASATVVGGGIDIERYKAQTVPRGHPNFVMGRSDLAEVSACPHRWVSGYDDEETEATEHGNLVDALLLSPETVERRFAICPDTYEDAKTGESKPWTFAAKVCKEWREAHAGATIVKADKFREAVAACDSLHADPDVNDLLDGAQTQVMVTGVYKDKETELSIPVKGLIDVVPAIGSPRFSKSLADLKTTADAGRRAWARAVYSRSYHWQAALYLDLWTKATGEDRVEFLHLVQENFAPWEHAKRIVSEEFVAIGRMQYSRALAKYARCLKDGFWPGYDPEDSKIQGWSLIQPEPWMAEFSG